MGAFITNKQNKILKDNELRARFHVRRGADPTDPKVTTVATICELVRTVGKDPKDVRVVHTASVESSGGDDGKMKALALALQNVETNRHLKKTKPELEDEVNAIERERDELKAQLAALTEQNPEQKVVDEQPVETAKPKTTTRKAKGD